MASLFTHGKPSTPTGYKVAPKSYADLEQVAGALRGHLPSQKGEKYRLDCARILEDTLQRAGFRLKVELASEMGDYAAFTVPNEQIIVLRDDIYDLVHTDNVYGRSTVVHEMSHIVLQHAVTLYRGAEAGKHGFHEDSEWQAKALTASTMMPIEACRDVRSATELAQMCGTSVQAATYRMDRLVKAGIVANRTEGLQMELPF